MEAAQTRMTNPSSDAAGSQAGGIELSQIVLIVEDEKLIAWDVEMLLLEAGARRVLTALTLAEARMHLHTSPDITIALIDLRLPDGSGEELIDELRARNIAIIVLTGYSADPIAGTQMLTKPYTSGQLLQAFRQAIARRDSQSRS
jgi:DNA-binding NtrC family response regulator